MAKLVEIVLDENNVPTKHTYEAKDGKQFSARYAAIAEAAADAHDQVQASTLGQLLKERAETRRNGGRLPVAKLASEPRPTRWVVFWGKRDNLWRGFEGRYVDGGIEYRSGAGVSAVNSSSHFSEIEDGLPDEYLAREKGDGLKQAQELVDRIVKAMIEKGYPVEATNKAGHEKDRIPCDQVSPWTHDVCRWTGNSYFEDNLARVLIGGWHSKGALIQLLVEIRRAKS